MKIENDRKDGMPSHDDPFAKADLRRRPSGDLIPSTNIDRDYLNEVLGLELLANGMDDDLSFVEKLQVLVADRGGRLLHTYAQHFNGEDPDLLVANLDPTRLNAMDQIVDEGNRLFNTGQFNRQVALELAQRLRKLLLEA